MIEDYGQGAVGLEQQDPTPETEAEVLAEDQEKQADEETPAEETSNEDPAAETPEA